MLAILFLFLQRLISQSLSSHIALHKIVHNNIAYFQSLRFFLFCRLLVSSIGAEKLPVSAYIFDSPVRSRNCLEEAAAFGVDSSVCFEAAHGSELPYVFNSEQATR